MKELNNLDRKNGTFGDIPSKCLKLSSNEIALHLHIWNHHIIDQNIFQSLLKLADKGVSQKFPVWAVTPKLRISELWSRGFWGLALKGLNGVQGKALENFGSLELTHIFICSSIFRVNIRVA